ncbi:hypothetical protein [Myxosarcina sp. GI1(2024)]
MVTKIWQQGSSSPDNANNLQAIADWWQSLSGKEIFWQQRLLPDSGNFEELEWREQKFDEKFLIQTPQLKGITVFWQRHNDKTERNITARKLELDNFRQKLYIYPQSQSQVIICVSLPEVIYQKLDLNNPKIAASGKENNFLLLLRDSEQKLEVTVHLNRQKLQQILHSLDLDETSSS